MTISIEHALEQVTPADIDYAKQLRRENAGTWQARWLAGVPHAMSDAAGVVAALEAFLALSDVP